MSAATQLARTPPTGGAPGGAGELIRAWRRRRGMSQSVLAGAAGVSSRHLSFVETGRASPSRALVAQLCEAMQLPLRERNAVMLAAGFAPLFGERELDEEAMRPARDALSRILLAHEPFPALLLDGRWNIRAANRAARILCRVPSPALLRRPNLIRLVVHPDGLAPRVVNFGQWSASLLARLARTAAATGDRGAEALLAECARLPGVEWDAHTPAVPASEPLLVHRLRSEDGGMVLSLFSAVTSFSDANDVVLSDLSVEAFHPADDLTREFLQRAAAQPGASAGQPGKLTK